MKYESMILASLFTACFALCVLVMGAMLVTSVQPVQIAGAQAAPVPAGTAG